MQGAIELVTRLYLPTEQVQNSAVPLSLPDVDPARVSRRLNPSEMPSGYPDLEGCVKNIWASPQAPHNLLNLNSAPRLETRGLTRRTL